MTGFNSKRDAAADKFIASEERKVSERYGYVPKLHPSEWIGEPAQECPNLKNCEGACFQCKYFNAETGKTEYPAPLPVQEPVTERETLKLALEALENHCGNYKLDDAGCERWNKAVDAIQEALAQPAQEPVECLDCGSHNVGVPANYDSLVDSVKAQPVQEPVAYEREQCAKMVDHILKYGGGTYGDAIRARSKT